jgi:hypothetical protein
MRLNTGLRWLAVLSSRRLRGRCRRCDRFGSGKLGCRGSSFERLSGGGLAAGDDAPDSRGGDAAECKKNDSKAGIH